jgi:hypothetical protein
LDLVEISWLWTDLNGFGCNKYRQSDIVAEAKNSDTGRRRRRRRRRRKRKRRFVSPRPDATQYKLRFFSGVFFKLSFLLLLSCTDDYTRNLFKYGSTRTWVILVRPE